MTRFESVVASVLEFIFPNYKKFVSPKQNK